MNQLPPQQNAHPEGARTGSRPQGRVDLVRWLADREPELIAFRRELHAYPELGNQEFRTTERIAARLAAAGLEPRIMPSGTGLLCDIEPRGTGAEGATIAATAAGPNILAIRADIDALPIQESADLPFRSTVDGVSHSCGHDLHTTAVLGAGLFLAEQARSGALTEPIRLVFQPAEEVMPGGALSMIENGALADVSRIIGVHCDPKVDVGRIGLRAGPLTAACDKLVLRLSGPGGHTSRPHLTVDLVFALAALVTGLPAALSRRVDPRAGLSLVWGAINAGNASNAIPQHGEAQGTVRCLDERAWRAAPDLVQELVDAISAAYGAKTELHYIQGVPPVVNDVAVIEVMREAAHRIGGADVVVPTEQSLGGEDFSWYLQHVPGAMARLGVRTPGDSAARDLHQPSFLPDERAITIGARFFAETALGQRG
jgi:amidohydrolase